MDFSISEVSQSVSRRMQDTGVWQKECPISMKRLRLLTVSHYDFAGNIQVGHMVVLDIIANSVIDIFKELYQLKFSIQSIKTIDELDGDDEKSMEVNNSSCFNFRPISGTSMLSIHSYGLAIDINPVQNPYLIGDGIFPEDGKDFLDREDQRPGMVEPIVDIFKKYGFEWGGDWSSPVDYHHFQIPRARVDKA